MHSSSTRRTGINKTHTHLECPSTILLLDTIYRAVMTITCVNAKEEVRIRSLSPRELVEEFRLELVTGYRHADQSRVTKGHYDLPMKDCTVHLDNTMIIENGNYVIPEMIAKVEPRAQH